MEKFTLPSGAILEVGLLPYEEAWKVQQKIASVFDSVKIELGSVDWQNLFKTDLLVLKGPICQILSSDQVIAAAKECFKRCLYNSVKIDSMTFDSKDARQDFLYCVAYAIKENIEPFFKGLVSSLQAK